MLSYCDDIPSTCSSGYCAHKRMHIKCVILENEKKLISENEYELNGEHILQRCIFDFIGVAKLHLFPE